MSILCLSHVMRHSEATLGARLVVFVLAEFAHDDGSKAFPSVETLMERTRMSRRGVQEALRRLEAEGEVEKTGVTKAGTSVYRVVLDRGAESARGGADGDVAGAQLTTSRGAVAAPNPLVTQHPDPSEKKKRASAPKIIPTEDEPIGFSQWLGYHHEVTGRSVPKAGTQTRSDLARAFGSLVGQGYELDDFKAVTDFGHLDPYWADKDLTLDWHLRLGAFGERVESGRRLRAKVAAAAPASVDAVDWSRFDA